MKANKNSMRLSVLANIPGNRTTGSEALRLGRGGAGACYFHGERQLFPFGHFR
jgi:hypothetical protein